MTWGGVIATFEPVSLNVSRPTSGSYVVGTWVPGTPTSHSISAVIQPLSGRDLQLLPDGLHATESRKIYTTDEVRVSDEISVDSETWVVFNVARWNFSGSYYRAYLSRKAVP